MTEGISKININGKWYNCLKNKGSFEHKKYGTTSPISQLKFIKIIDEISGYFVDGAGILWILEVHIFDKEKKEETIAFSRPCLYWCLTYVMGIDRDMKDKKPSEVLEIIGINDPRKDTYDKEFEEKIREEND